MTYDECVCDAAIAVFSSRQIAAPQSAIDLAEVIADALKDNGYIEEPVKAELKKPKAKRKHGSSITTSDDRVSA